MRTLKVLSALLSYPRTEMLEALDEMAEVLQREDLLPAKQKAALIALMDSWRGADLQDLQESYVGLFDQGRSLSLHIFEHVHGESRDRGQAMVDLMRLYQTRGFEISARELPDHVPLFLEYLSLQSREEAVALLRDALPVLSLLGARLRQRASGYHVVFDALAAFAGNTEAMAEMSDRAASEGPDETLVHMDELWEEEAVSFMGGQPARNRAGECGGRVQTEQPIVIAPRAKPASSSQSSPRRMK
jgi:nitrate reductase delta subunit